VLVGEVDGFDGVEFMIGSYARGRLASGATGLTAVAKRTSARLTGRPIFHVIDPSSRHGKPGRGQSVSPAIPHRYDDSAVVVLPHNCTAVAVHPEKA